MEPEKDERGNKVILITLRSCFAEGDVGSAISLLSILFGQPYSFLQFYWRAWRLFEGKEKRLMKR